MLTIFIFCFLKFSFKKEKGKFHIYKLSTPRKKKERKKENTVCTVMNMLSDSHLEE